MIDVIVILVFIASIFFTCKYRFIQRKSLKIATKALLGKEKKSAYQTFMVALASHIGTGNIVGISTAIIYGGAGSLFWMWIFAVTTSIFALIENTLAQVYKEKICGEYRGGSSYYVKKGLNKPLLAILMAVFLVLANTIFFQPLQVNTISETLHIVWGMDKIIIMGILYLFTIFVIFGGTKKIVKFSEVIVPIMSIGYIIFSIVIICINITTLPSVFATIFKEAFNLQSIFCGGMGSCLLVGMKRSMFSHEAGLGTMPTISAMADIDRPTTQGHIQVLGVFFDTIILCSLTGFMILLYNFDATSFTGCDLIIYIFEETIGSFGKVIAVFFLLTFALATVVSEYYLGESNLIFLTKQKINKKAIFLYQLLFLCGITIGSLFTTKDIWKIVDLGMALMGVLNIYALYKLQNVFRDELIKETVNNT